MARSRQYVDPSDVSAVINDEKSSISGVTAGATQTIAGGYQITRTVTSVSTVGTAGDAVTLPVALAGDRRVVMNKGGGNSLNVFPGNGTDKINVLSAGAAYALASTKVVEFICAVDGTWDTLLTA